MRARGDDRLVARQAPDHDVQEAADQGPYDAGGDDLEGGGHGCGEASGGFGRRKRKGGSEDPPLAKLLGVGSADYHLPFDGHAPLPELEQVRARTPLAGLVIVNVPPDFEWATIV